jgi:hypothetical protein
MGTVEATDGERWVRAGEHGGNKDRDAALSIGTCDVAGRTRVGREMACKALDPVKS